MVIFSDFVDAASIEPGDALLPSQLPSPFPSQVMGPNTSPYRGTPVGLFIDP